jgi:hypothetical protein
VPISSQTLPSIPRDDSEAPLIVQQEKLLRSAVSDYIDRIVDGCGLRQRVITQPRPLADLGDGDPLPFGLAPVADSAMS